MTGVRFPTGSEILLFTTMSRPKLESTQSPTQRLPRGGGVFSLEYSCRGVKLTTQHHLVPRLGMCGAIPPLPYTVSWRGAYLSTRITLPLHEQDRPSLCMNSCMYYFKKQAYRKYFQMNLLPTACLILYATYTFFIKCVPEDASDVFLRNVGNHLWDYTASQPTKPQSECW
jgi:hypothetical protein